MSYTVVSLLAYIPQNISISKSYLMVSKISYFHFLSKVKGIKLQAKSQLLSESIRGVQSVHNAFTIRGKSTVLSKQTNITSLAQPLLKP